TPTKARPTTPIPIRMRTTPATDGCGWRRHGFGAGGPIPTLASAVPSASAGIVVCTGAGMVGADTAADTAAAIAAASAVAIAVVPLAAIAGASALGIAAASG